MVKRDEWEKHGFTVRSAGRRAHADGSVTRTGLVRFDMSHSTEADRQGVDLFVHVEDVPDEPDEDLERRMLQVAATTAHVVASFAGGLLGIDLCRCKEKRKGEKRAGKKRKK